MLQKDSPVLFQRNPGYLFNSVWFSLIQFGSVLVQFGSVYFQLFNSVWPFTYVAEQQ